MQKITSNLWFDKNAEEAVNFYASLFPNSKINSTSRFGKEGFEHHGIPEGMVMTMSFELMEQKFVALNGGPLFKFNPSISFFAVFENKNEIDRLWNKLKEGGQIMMDLDKYDWSEIYGWVQDKFGLSWQLLLGDRKFYPQSISPLLLFTGLQKNNAEKAINFYQSVFKNSEIIGIEKYGSDGRGVEGSVMFSQFKLNGNVFMAMDSPIDHQFTFNEAISFIITCETQEDVDYYWNQFTEEGSESMCGWLKDKFGVSWQIIPSALYKFIGDKDREKSSRALNAMFQMKKLDILTLQKAFDG